MLEPERELTQSQRAPCECLPSIHSLLLVKNNDNNFQSIGTPPSHSPLTLEKLVYHSSVNQAPIPWPQLPIWRWACCRFINAVRWGTGRRVLSFWKRCILALLRKPFPLALEEEAKSPLPKDEAYRRQSRQPERNCLKHITEPLSQTNLEAHPYFGFSNKSLLWFKPIVVGLYATEVVNKRPNLSSVLCSYN